MKHHPYILDIEPKVGIYYVYDRTNEIIYIGESENIDRRINDHFRSGRFSRKVTVRWEEVLDRKTRKAREARLIRYYAPKLNAQSTLWERTRSEKHPMDHRVSEAYIHNVGAL